MKSYVPLVLLAVACLMPQIVSADNSNLSTQVIQCTFKITDGHTNGTGFVLSGSKEGDQAAQLLVTAAHVFEQIGDDEATSVVRKQMKPTKNRISDFGFDTRERRFGRSTPRRMLPQSGCPFPRMFRYHACRLSFWLRMKC